MRGYKNDYKYYGATVYLDEDLLGILDVMNGVQTMKDETETRAGCLHKRMNGSKVRCAKSMLDDERMKQEAECFSFYKQGVIDAQNAILFSDQDCHEGNNKGVLVGAKTPSVVPSKALKLRHMRTWNM